MHDFLARQFPSHGPLAQPISDWRLWLVLLGAILLASTVHEFGHAWMADRLGDPGPRQQGRVSLNPLRHLDPLGTLLMAITMLIGFPIGWGKPVKTDPEKFRCGKRTGQALVAAAGPLGNLALALVLAPVVRWLMAGGAGDATVYLLWVLMLLVVTVAICVGQFCFNLVPVHPMDGAHVVAALLPERAATLYVDFMRRYGTYVFLGLVWTGSLDHVLVPMITGLFRWLIGI